ncbi:DUF2339 domain-containing protein [Myxococcota bacterium]|nr:DUF2339 domain-containing protein [Myxococcota bacterium]
MEELLLTLAVLIGIALLILPIVATALVVGARKRITTLEREVDLRKTELRYLYDRLEAEKKERDAATALLRSVLDGRAEPGAATTVRAATDDRPREATRADAAAHAPIVSEDEATAPARPATIEGAEDLAGVGPGPQDRIADAGVGPGPQDRIAGAGVGPSPQDRIAGAGAGPGPQDRIAGAGTGPGPQDRVASDRPPPRRAPPRAPSVPPAPQVPFEQRLATWFTRIGAGALLLGVLYFYKYAVDNEWIGPAGRVAAGAGVGLLVITIAEVIRAKTKPAFVQVLLGVGLAFLYVTAYASSAFYHLVAVPAAFGINAVILLVGAVLAWRHRAEAVLVLVSIAGFLNPVLLSTGEDRPFALFTYLLVMTSVTLFVAVKERFRIALGIAVAGVAMLFAGWYDRFFEVFDHRGLEWAADRPPEELVGAYLALSTRVVPLVFVALFTAQWLVAAFALRRPGTTTTDAPPPMSTGTPKALAIAALLLSHVGATALLYDHVRLLGGAMIALALLAVFTLRSLDASRFLLVPMLAAFTLLAGLTADVRGQDHLLLLGLMGLWSSVYVVAFLKEVADEHRALTKADAIRASIGIGAFAVLATILLFPGGHLLLLGLVLTLASAALVVIAGRASFAILAPVTLVLALIPWLGAAVEVPDRGDHVDWAFLAIAAAWWAVYAVTLTRDALSGRDRSWTGLLTLALSGLAFLAIGLASTSEETPTLRALLTALVGVVDLALATLLAKKDDAALRPWVTVLAALALGLFAPAVAFGLSGATITVAWALLVLVALIILAESREPVWLALAIGLGAITLFRVLAVDIEGVEQQLREFTWSGGRRGVLSVPAFLNARAYALTSFGLSLLAGALVLARAAKRDVADAKVASKTLLTLAPIAATIAYAMLTTMLVVETRTALLELPPAPTMPLDQEELSIFMMSVDAAKAEHRNLLAMSTTLILAVVAMALLGAGFAARDPFHRYLGLALFLGTIGKLVMWDVWNLPRLYQVVVLTFVGVLLLGSGFLYARLKALFRGEAAAITGLLLILCASQPANADVPPPKARLVEIGRYTHKAAIQGLDAPGDYAIAIGAELYQKSQSEGLFADVRITDDEGREVPYVVEAVPPERIPSDVEGRIFDPGTTGDGSYRASFELPEDVEAHCEVRLQTSAPGAYLRRTRIETGATANDLQVVASGGMIWSLYGDGASGSSTTLSYPRSAARWVRVTLLPDADGPLVELQGARFSCLDRTTTPPRDRMKLTITGTKQDPERGTTTVELDAGAEGVPIDRLHLSVGPGELVRRVHVRASSYKSAWPSIGYGLVHRVEGAPEHLTLDVRDVRKRYLQLVFEDGADAPIVVTAVEASFPSRTLVVRAKSPGAHTLWIGDKTANAPQYDLAEVFERRRGELVRAPATLAALEPNPSLGQQLKDADLPVTERWRGTIGAVLGVALAGLAVWAIRLLKSPRP